MDQGVSFQSWDRFVHSRCLLFHEYKKVESFSPKIKCLAFLGPRILRKLLIATFPRALLCWTLSSSVECDPLVDGLKQFFSRSTHVILILPICWWLVRFLAWVLQCVSTVSSWGSKETPSVWELKLWEDLRIASLLVILSFNKNFPREDSRGERDTGFDLDALVERSGNGRIRRLIHLHGSFRWRNGCWEDA